MAQVILFLYLSIRTECCIITWTLSWNRFIQYVFESKNSFVANTMPTQGQYFMREILSINSFGSSLVNFKNSENGIVFSRMSYFIFCVSVITSFFSKFICFVLHLVFIFPLFLIMSFSKPSIIGCIPFSGKVNWSYISRSFSLNANCFADTTNNCALNLFRP